MKANDLSNMGYRCHESSRYRPHSLHETVRLDANPFLVPRLLWAMCDVLKVWVFVRMFERSGMVFGLAVSLVMSSRFFSCFPRWLRYNCIPNWGGMGVKKITGPKGFHLLSPGRSGRK